MDRTFLVAGFCGVALLAACSAPPPGRAPEQPEATLPLPPAAAPVILLSALESYKKSVADRIALASPDVFVEPLPEMLRSIVVLDITIDREGQLANVTVRRSNGYKALENRAIESVKRASPFGAPAFTARGRDGSVSFLETFLFRDDGRFRIRSLVEQP